MRGSFLVAISLLLVGCHHRKPAMSDAELQRIRARLPGMTDVCANRLKWGGIRAMPNELDQCFKMMPPERWQGLWRRDIETSIFCSAPAKQCPSGNPMGLEFKVKVPGIGAETTPRGLYAVEFIGSRTANGGIYGDGPLAQELVVDRLISIKGIEAPPKQ